MDYYEILGIARDASKADVKKAFRKLAHQHHPDKGGDESKFKKINEAYQTLSDDSRRKQYDSFGHGGPQGFDFTGYGNGGGDSGFDVNDISDKLALMAGEIWAIFLRLFLEEQLLALELASHEDETSQSI